MADGAGTGEPRRPRFRWGKVVNIWTILIVPLTGIVISIITLVSPPSDRSAADTTRTSPPTASSASTAPPSRVPWNHSTLTLMTGMNANLQSRSADFDGARSMNWPPGDVAYDKSSDGAPGYTLYLKDAPRTTAALGTSGHWGYDTCVNAQYGGNDDRNTPWQDNIAAGHGLCFNPSGDWYILLKVISQDATQITLDVTSWKS